MFADFWTAVDIVHQIRNSIKYVGSANQKLFAHELKTVYQAFTKEEALSRVLINKWVYRPKRLKIT